MKDAFLDRPGLSLGSSDGQDGVIGLAGPAHLNVAEAGLVEHVGVLGWRALPALRLHQHVEGEDLSHDGPSSVLKQHGFHQQDAAACQEGRTRTKTLSAESCECVSINRLSVSAFINSVGTEEGSKGGCICYVAMEPVFRPLKI